MKPVSLKRSSPPFHDGFILKFELTALSVFNPLKMSQNLISISFIVKELCEKSFKGLLPSPPPKVC